MKFSRTLKTPLMAGLVLAGGLLSNSALAVDNATFTKLFDSYESSVEAYVSSLTEKKWADAGKAAHALEKQSKHLMELAQKDDNKFWEFDATNLWHHSEELVEATESKDAVEGVYLTGVLLAHIGYIQSANPSWLREHIRDQIQVIEEGINKKDRDATRDAAEVTHVSANKIVLSAGLQKELYVHTRWLDDVRQMNRLGDAIIGSVNEGDFDKPKGLLKKIQLAFNKWDKAFR